MESPEFTLFLDRDYQWRWKCTEGSATIAKSEDSFFNMEDAKRAVVRLVASLRKMGN